VKGAVLDLMRLDVRKTLDRRTALRTFGIVGTSALTTLGGAELYGRASKYFRGYYIQLGTSITAGAGTKYGAITPSIVGKVLGLRAINGGFPGACAGLHKIPQMNPISLCSLVDAIISDDWSSQKNMGSEPNNKKFPQLTAAFPNVAYLGLEYGTNDFNYDRPIGVIGSETVETFIGGLSYSLRKLATTFPAARIFLITPSWFLTSDGRNTDDVPNGLGLFLKDYVSAMVQVAEQFHIPCLNFWRSLGVNASNYKSFLADGLHPTDLGAIRRGEAIGSFLTSTF